MGIRRHGLDSCSYLQHRKVNGRASAGLLLGCLVALAAIPQEASIASDRTKMLESVAVPGGAVVLIADSCAESGCDLSIGYQPKRGKRQLIKLTHRSSSRNFSREPIDGAWGAVDLLAPENVDVAWMSGDEEDYTSTSMRIAPLSEGATAIVVDQRGGFEHIGHAHLLAVLAGGKLTEGHRWETASGPVWTGVNVVGDEVLFHSVLFWDADQPNEWTVTSYRWVAPKRSLQVQKRKAPLWAVVANSYKSFATARKDLDSISEAVNSESSCLGGLGVLSVKGVLSPTEDMVFVGAISTNKTFATRKAATIGKCATRWKNVRVVRVT
jgi:hypothetical protein